MQNQYRRNAIAAKYQNNVDLIEQQAEIYRMQLLEMWDKLNSVHMELLQKETEEIHNRMSALLDELNHNISAVENRFLKVDTLQVAFEQFIKTHSENHPDDWKNNYSSESKAITKCYFSNNLRRHVNFSRISFQNRILHSCGKIQLKFLFQKHSFWSKKNLPDRKQRKQGQQQ